MSGWLQLRPTIMAPRRPFWLITSPVTLKIFRKETAPVELRATFLTSLPLGRRLEILMPMPPP